MKTSSFLIVQTVTKFKDQNNLKKILKNQILNKLKYYYKNFKTLKFILKKKSLKLKKI